jgi:hypothetical protein
MALFDELRPEFEAVLQRFVDKKVGERLDKVVGPTIESLKEENAEMRRRLLEVQGKGQA